MKLIALLDTAEGWIADLPPVEQPQRFGNKAFRDWFKKLQQVNVFFSWLLTSTLFVKKQKNQRIHLKAGKRKA